MIVMREVSFDFGKKPPVDGYTKINGQTLYSADKGYGLAHEALHEERGEGEKELYNLREDPGETRNRIGDAPERAERLAEQLADWRREAEK